MNKNTDSYLLLTPLRVCLVIAGCFGGANSSWGETGGHLHQEVSKKVFFVFFVFFSLFFLFSVLYLETSW